MKKAYKTHSISESNWFSNYLFKKTIGRDFWWLSVNKNVLASGPIKRIQYDEFSFFLLVLLYHFVVQSKTMGKHKSVAIKRKRLTKSTTDEAYILGETKIERDKRKAKKLSKAK